MRWRSLSVGACDRGCARLVALWLPPPGPSAALPCWFGEAPRDCGPWQGRRAPPEPVAFRGGPRPAFQFRE
eukprot:4672292-Pyramimonas_sp.AAC.1